MGNLLGTGGYYYRHSEKNRASLIQQIIRSPTLVLTTLTVFADEKVEKSTTPEEDEFDDPVERMLKKTGCLELHYSVQECIAETKDWRQCQQQVKDFRQCMEKFKNTTSSKRTNKL